jgi:hypothetical protein
MATGVINLPIGAAVLPDGSASNAAPAIQRVKSSAAAPTPYFLQAAFDAATEEQLLWPLVVPADYGGTPVLNLLFKMLSASTGDVIVEGRVAAVTAGDATDVDAKALDAANTSAAVAVPGTVGHLAAITLALTNADSLADGDLAVVYLARDATNAADTAAGDLELVGVALSYTRL